MAKQSMFKEKREVDTQVSNTEGRRPGSGVGKDALTTGGSTRARKATMAVQLTEDRLASVREVFSLFDKDNDGAIPTGMVICVLRSLGYNPAEKDVRELIDQFDPEGDAMIEFNTFIELMLKVSREGDTEEEMEEAFLVFDPPASGTISAVEIRQILTNMGEKLTEEEADDMIAFADTTGKGEINYREFIQILLNDS